MLSLEIIHFDEYWHVPQGYWSYEGHDDHPKEVHMGGTWWVVEWDDRLGLYVSVATSNPHLFRRNAQTNKIEWQP